MSTPNLKRYELRAQAAENRQGPDREQPGGDDVTVTPSQAEGNRETIERDLGDAGDDNFGRESGGQGQVQPTPSQAEGDRQTVERDLRKKRRDDHGS